MGFAALAAAETAMTAPPLAPEGNEAVNFLRKAIDAPSISEVRDLVRQEIVGFNMLNKIELVTPTETKMLEDKPRHFLFPKVLTTVNADIPTALIGPAGSGKSTMAGQIADALNLKYYLINSVSGTHELAGYMDAHGKYNTTSFRQAFEHGGLAFVDEVDTSDAGALKWLNTALANGHAMFPDSADAIQRHPKFRMMIGANTFGNGADRMYVGANQLDASTLDRFVFFDFGYDENLEVLLSGNAKWAERVQELRKAAMTEKARVIISPRATLYGAKLLSAGWTQGEVENGLIWKGMDPELQRRIIDRASGKLTQDEIDKAAKPKKKKSFN